MIIAIPTDYNTNDTTVCVSFGRAPYYLIYDTGTKNTSFLLNTAANSAGGAGIKAAQMIVDNKADALITIRCGENAANVLSSANIKIYKSINASAMDNVNAFNRGKLSILDNIHPGYHNHGNN